MIKKQKNKIIRLINFLMVLMMLIPLAACVSDANKKVDISSVRYFTEIPGIKEEEINKILALQEAGAEFSYGALLSMEAFISVTGEVDGFAVLFSEFLSDLFGIPFNVELKSWTEILSSLDDLSLDFTGELTPTPARRGSREIFYEVNGGPVHGSEYLMSLTIAERMLRVFTLDDSRITKEADLDGLRIGFLEDSEFISDIKRIYRIDFKAVEIRQPKLHRTNTDDYEIALEMLRNREIDAFVMPATSYAFFKNQEDIYSSLFFPMIYAPVSLTTANHDLRPIITVINKFIEAGGADVLLELYREGEQRYSRNRLQELLTCEEKTLINFFIEHELSISVGFDHDNYPVSFYNETTGRFEGISVDILEAVTDLTGITFAPGVPKNSTWSEILGKLITGEVNMVPELLYSEDREKTELFLWSAVPYSVINYALLSRVDAPLYAAHQVSRLRVGVKRSSGDIAVFEKVFPTAGPLILFDSLSEGLDALESGDIDLFMGSEFDLLFDINYRERSGLKMNIELDIQRESFFGFHASHQLLQSIVNKSQEFIDIDTIVNGWTRRQFDYFRMISIQRTNFAMLIISVMIIAMAVMTYVLQKNIKLRKRVIGTKSKLESVEKIRIEAEAASKAKSAFLAIMSHEIRTPLNAVLGITEIQLLNEDLNPDIREAFLNIYTSSDLLLSIINDILDLSKIESGKLELTKDDYEIASLISDTTHVNLMRIGSKPVEFKLHIDENIPASLVGDSLRVKQIFNNILSNAFKYTDHGCVEMSLSFTPNLTNENFINLIATIRDTGCGMSESQVKRLFDEYTRFNLEANRSTEGTGLGMSITKKLLSMMNGTISVESKPGEGTTVTITIPQEKFSSEILGLKRVENLQGFNQVHSKTKLRTLQINREPMPYGSVLIVDDVDINIFVASGLLIPYGIKIDSAKSGFKTIDKIKSGRVYDIIFMDHMMPKMDGIETTKRLRESGYTGTIIALTANAVAGQADIFLKNGFDDFISKPIDVRKLNIFLNKYIRDKQPPEVLQAAKECTGNVLNYTSDEIAVYNLKINEIFLRDAASSIKVIEEVLSKSELTGDDLNNYIISVHGIKSALGNIGKQELSDLAKELEFHGRNGEIDEIIKKTSGFLTSLKEVVAEFSIVNTDIITQTDENISDLMDKLQKIKAASEEYDEHTVDSLIVELKLQKWTQSTHNFLTKLSEYILHSDFENITQDITEFVDNY